MTFNLECKHEANVKTSSLPGDNDSTDSSWKPNICRSSYDDYPRAIRCSRAHVSNPCYVVLIIYASTSSVYTLSKKELKEV